MDYIKTLPTASPYGAKVQSIGTAIGILFEHVGGLVDSHRGVIPKMLVGLNGNLDASYSGVKTILGCDTDADAHTAVNVLNELWNMMNSNGSQSAVMDILLNFRGKFGF